MLAIVGSVSRRLRDGRLSSQTSQSAFSVSVAPTCAVKFPQPVSAKGSTSPITNSLRIFPVLFLRRCNCFLDTVTFLLFTEKESDRSTREDAEDKRDKVAHVAHPRAFALR